MEALRDASNLQSSNNPEMLPGLKDLGGVIVDLQGGNYKISKPITFPSSIANLVVSPNFKQFVNLF